MYILFFFFFKQKTAYEIYQCDWSSDVCSSDLSKGTLSEVSVEWWRVGNKMELTGIDTDLEGGAIELPE